MLEQHSALSLHASPIPRHAAVVVVVVDVVDVVVVSPGASVVVVVVDVVDVVVVLVVVVVAPQILNPVALYPPLTDTTQSITSVSFTHDGFGGSST